MKKFTLLLCVTVAALCLPQNLVAETNVNLTAGVLTINTTEAGTLASNSEISGLVNKGSVTSIILNGKFNSDDLGAISSNNGFNSVTTVDMSNAKFMGTTNNNYRVFSAESNRIGYSTSGLSTNDKSVVGDLYISGYQETKTWANVNDEPNVAYNNFQDISFSEEDRDSHKDDFNPSENIYIRFLQGTFYYQLTETRTWTDVTSSLDDITKNGITLTFDSEDLMNQDVNATNGNYAKVVAGYSYYLVEVVNNREATPVDFSNIPQDAKIVEQSGVNPDVWGTGVDVGCYIRTYSGFNYYQLATSNRHWESVNSLPEGKTAKTPIFTEADMNNNIYLDNPQASDYSFILVGDYIVFDRYNYYKLVVANELGWTTCSPVEGQFYDLGDRIYTNQTDLESNSPDQANLYAVVGGSLEMWNGTEWSTDTEVYDWTQMKFSYWGSTLKTVKLPTQPQNVIAANLHNDIWNGCSVLEKVYSGETYADITKEGGNNYATVYSKSSDEDTRMRAILRLTSFISQDDRFTSKTLTVTGYDTETKTLTIGTDETRTLAELVSVLNASGAEKIVFSDGSEWTNADGGTLTVKSTSDYTTIKTELENNNFPVKKIVFGKYVTYDVENDVTIVSTSEGPLGNNIADKADMTDVEKNLLYHATKLKMVGSFSSDDLQGLKGQLVSGNSGSMMVPTVLDLSEANLTTRLPDSWGTSVTTITMPTSFTNVPNGGTTESPEYANNKIPDEFCGGYSNLTTITIPDGVKIIGKYAFKNCPNLSIVNWSTNGAVTNGNPNSTVEEVQEGAFHNTGLGSKADGASKEERSFHVPNSIKTIGQDAFHDCPGISYLYFDEGSNLQSIAKGAFWFEGTLNGTAYDGLKEVHVKCNHFIECDLEAFDEQHTNGHTAVENAKCRLFYPPISSDYKNADGTSRTESNSFDDYVGNWKADYYPGGVITSQADLQALHDIAKNGKTVGDNQYGPYPAHGWHMFTSTGVTFTSNTEWRTYSEQVPFEVPELTTAEIYLVCGFAHNGNAGAVTLIRMIPGEVVPANTGVLVHYTYKGGGSSLIFPGIWTIKYIENNHVPYDNENNPESPYVKNSTQYPNYLKKINNETIYIPNVVVMPDGTRPYRNFFFNNCTWLADDNNSSWRGDDYSKSLDPQEGWAFLRAVSDNYSVNNKAYLHLPSSLAGKEAGYGTSPGTSTDDPSNARLLGICIIDDNDSEPTKVENVDSFDYKDGSSYYSLQGQKVSTPLTQGIYIHNGKKVIVK